MIRMIDEHKRYITYILAETDVKRQQMLYNLYIDTMKMFHVKLNSIDINVLKVIDNKVKNDKGMKELLKTDATKNLCKQNAIKVDLASIFDRTEPIEDYKLVPEPNHLVKRYKCNTLKKGWEQRVSETGEIDYHNPETGKSQTERPKSCKFSAIKDGTTKFVLRDPRDPGNCDTCRVPLTDVSPGTYINENDDAIKKKRSKLYKEFDKCYEDHTSPEAFARFNKFVLDMSQRVDLLSDTPTDLKPLYSPGTKKNPKYGATYQNKPWYLDYNKAIKRKPRSFYKYLIKYNKDGKHTNPNRRARGVSDGTKLKDLLRCTLTFKHGTDLQKALNYLIYSYSEHINMVKNGWANYKKEFYGEYVDVKIIFMIPGTLLCCEVQLITEAQEQFKKQLHKDYGMVRIVNSVNAMEFDNVSRDVLHSKDETYLRRMRDRYQAIIDPTLSKWDRVRGAVMSPRQVESDPSAANET